MKSDIPILNRGFQDLNPLVLGWERCRPGYSFGPHTRDYYLIHYIQSGKGVLCNDDGIHPVSAGQIFIIHPGQVTTYIADQTNPWTYIWVGFDGALANRLQQIETWTLPYPEDTFVRLRAVEKLSSTREEFVAGQLFSMFSVLLDQESAPHSYEQQVTDYILSNYMRTVRVEEIAQMVGLDRRYLGRIFKNYAGMTMQEFLIQTRLDHAAKYLKHGETVSNAAAMAGYADVFHFSKMFKKRFNLSPQQYRKAKQRKDGANRAN